MFRTTPAGYPAITVPWLWADGAACWLFVLLRRGLSEEQIERILRHEDVHLRQQRWIYPWWLLRYWTSDSYRLRQEAPAYAQNVLWYAEQFGDWIITAAVSHYARTMHQSLYRMADTFTLTDMKAALSAAVSEASG